MKNQINEGTMEENHDLRTQNRIDSIGIIFLTIFALGIIAMSMLFIMLLSLIF